MKKGIEPKYKFLGILLLFVIGIIAITAAPVGTKPIPGHNGSQIQPGTILGDRMADNLNLTGNVSISDVLNVNGNVNITGTINGRTIADLSPVGTINMYGAAAAPTGWVLCDGASLARTGTYASLFAVIGTTYGSVDGNTFNVPDMRGVFPKGAGTTTRTAGKDANGNYYAGTLGTYLTDKMQGHFHNAGGVLNSRASGTTTTAWGIYISDTNDGLAGARFPITDGTNGAPRTGMTTEPQSLGVNFIIKY